jgi:hypothetical protein
MAIASFIAGEAISANDAVYLDSNSLLRKSIATSFTQASVVGVALNSGNTGTLVSVNTDSIQSGFTSLVPGDFQYVSAITSGSLVSYNSWAAQLSTTTLSGLFLSPIGRALTPTSVEIELTIPTHIIK